MKPICKICDKVSKKFNPPNIKKARLHRLWFEDKKGNVRALTEREMRHMKFPSVKKWPYAFSCFPTSVVTSIYRRRKDGGYGSKDCIGRSESGVSKDLVIALVLKRKLSLDHAMMTASQACERCMNILAWQLGLKWGYNSRSDAAKKCNTSCRLCAGKEGE